ncbi:MAG: thiolase domain-containing protein [Deltaproteobacteria bacterium]|nr:thiolase domain-containing protein [Deltaproteobacteria bacterium]
MRSVSIIGVGTTNFGVLEGTGIKEMASLACNRAIVDAGIDRKQVQSFYLGNYIGGILVGQETLAPVVACELGLQKTTACTKVEGACCSSGIALRQAYLLIAAGVYDFVLVGGVEKMSSASTAKNTEALAAGMDKDKEGYTGLTFPGYFGLVAQRHMHEFGTTIEQIGMVSVKNRQNAVRNPRARFRKETTLEAVLASRLITDPLKLMDCCPIADGAAAAVLCPTEMAREFSPSPIEVLGSGHGLGQSTSYAMDGPSCTCTVYAAREAFARAGIAPSDVDVAEVHDCFTIAEIVDTEDIGFFERGRGGPAVEEGLTRVDGRIPINPSGGLLSKGHPVGATGLGQIYELVKQLRGEHENQVKDAEIGLAMNLGASGLVSTVTILRRS